MYKAFIVVLLAVSSASAFWAECPNRPNAVAPTRVESAACSGSQCIVTRGETLVADGHLTFRGAHARLDVGVTAYILGIPVNLPQSPPDDNACNSMFNAAGVLTGCPTTPNQPHIWKIRFGIPANYPAFSNARVRFELSENNNVVACVDVTATLR